MRKLHLILILGFVIIYSLFITQIDIRINHFSEIILSTVFFFALFSGFFITRQNDRYCKIMEAISNSDGLFSYLYRVSGLVPRIQKEVREIIRDHYTKIMESNNWAYHILRPSVTITRLTKTFGKVSDEESSRPAVSTSYEVIWHAILNLQSVRKKIIVLYNEKLLPFQWALIYVLGGILVVSFNLIPSSSIFVDMTKIVLGIAVFLVIILLKQLNDLSIFGKDFSKKLARDIFRIIDEKDIAEIQKVSKNKLVEDKDFCKDS